MAMDTRMICKHCGSENVSVDATARWSVEAQEWQISDVMDHGGVCEDCSGDAVIIEQPGPQDRAAAHGCYIGHDLGGWYVAQEEEREQDETQGSVGFDGRAHFQTADAAADSLGVEG